MLTVVRVLLWPVRFPLCIVLFAAALYASFVLGWRSR